MVDAHLLGEQEGGHRAEEAADEDDEHALLPPVLQPEGQGADNINNNVANDQEYVQCGPRRKLSFSCDFKMLLLVVYRYFLSIKPLWLKSLKESCFV